MTKIYYKIKNTETGSYYLGQKCFVKNPNYDEVKYFQYNRYYPELTVPLAKLQQYGKFYRILNGKFCERTYNDRKIEFTADELPPWISGGYNFWGPIGKLYESRKGAELALSKLTKTSKKLRSNKVDFLLNAPQDAAKYKIIVCKMEIIEISSEDEAKILQSGQENKQEVNK